MLIFRPATGLWGVILGTTEMQCEMAGDMYASLGGLFGSASGEIEHTRQHMKELVKIIPG